MTLLQPVATSERIHILDILRGFAILGILAVNIGGMASPMFYPGYSAPPGPWYDALAETLRLFLAEGKFYTIFSFLFGLGFAVQLARAQAKGRDLHTFYPRRLWALLGLGVVHSVLFWIGDILRLYAVWGFALLGLHQRRARTLLIGAGIAFGVGWLMLAALGGPHGGDEAIPGWDVVAMARNVYTTGTFAEVAVFQLGVSLFSFLFIVFSQGGTVMALFLLGLVVGRAQFFERLAEHEPTLRRIFVMGLLLGLPLNALFVFSTDAWLSSLGFALGSPALAAVYISGLAWLSLRPVGRALLRPLAHVGRMALSNYVLQSIVSALIFNGYGLGWYERIGAAGLWGITFSIYLLQIPFSAWWLSRFHYGPLEWLWRSLTYAQWQPFVKQERKI